MLTKLLIQNIALIDKIEIDFGSGLNILTGETGAGKSIVIDSITAIIGGRISKDLIRSGAEKAVVEGLFLINCEDKKKELQNIGFELEEDNVLLVVRELYQNGKNICRINGRMVTVSMLKYLGEILIDIHGQHDNQSLLQTENHIEFLDSFIGENFSRLKEKYSEKFNHLKNLKSELSSMVYNPEERLKKLDLFDFQIKEISRAELKENEEDELTHKKTMFTNAEKVACALSNSYEILTGSNAVNNSIHSLLNKLIKEINQISFIDEKYLNTVDSLEEMSYHIEEISRDIRVWRDSIEFNPQSLETIEERLDLIARLKRKYGKDIGSILLHLANLEKEYEELLNNEEKISALCEKINILKDDLIDICRNMSDKRLKYAKILEAKIENELENLEMKKTRFSVKIEYNKESNPEGMPSFNLNGLDRVEFLISPNLGEAPKPLAKIASGGEMSRIMLAVKTILAKVDKKTTLIFDEIDTGISGKAAQAVGEKLVLISTGHQVICVTHLAHIAAMADIHFSIKKNIKSGRTMTDVNIVEGNEKCEAIAIILGGSSITDITMQHAKQIIDYSNDIKSFLRSKI